MESAVTAVALYVIVVVLAQALVSTGNVHENALANPPPKNKEQTERGGRLQADRGIRKRSVPPVTHRQSGIQDSSQAQCLSHISGD